MQPKSLNQCQTEILVILKGVSVSFLEGCETLVMWQIVKLVSLIEAGVEARGAVLGLDLLSWQFNFLPMIILLFVPSKVIKRVPFC